MKLTVEEGRVLRQALTELNAGDGRKFDDALWLGLGDGCAKLWDALAGGAYIKTSHEGVACTTITDRGRRLLQSLSTSLEQAVNEDSGVVPAAKSGVPI